MKPVPFRYEQLREVELVTDNVDAIVGNEYITGNDAGVFRRRLRIYRGDPWIREVRDAHAVLVEPAAKRVECGAGRRDLQLQSLEPLRRPVRKDPTGIQH